MSVAYRDGYITGLWADVIANIDLHAHDLVTSQRRQGFVGWVQLVIDCLSRKLREDLCFLHWLFMCSSV